MSANAFAMVFKTRYLLLIGADADDAELDQHDRGVHPRQHRQRHRGGDDRRLVRPTASSEGQLIGDFYAKYFALVNILSLVLQLFVVSRIVKYWGVSWAVMVLPALSFGAYNILVFVPTLYAVLAAKVAENSTDYSLNNTVRNMLFLPCTYEQKFSAKQAIDSFFVRMGDVLSAALVFVGTTFALQPRGFALVNAMLVAVFATLAWRVGRYYNTLSTSGTAPAMAGGTGQGIPGLAPPVPAKGR